MDVWYSLGEVGTELWTVITLDSGEGEQGFSLRALKEINGIAGIGFGISPGVRPPTIHVEAREDIHSRAVGFHEVDGVHLH